MTRLLGRVMGREHKPPDKETSTQPTVASQTAMHCSRVLVLAVARSPPEWSIPHSITNVWFEDVV